MRLVNGLLYRRRQRLPMNDFDFVFGFGFGYAGHPNGRSRRQANWKPLASALMAQQSCVVQLQPTHTLGIHAVAVAVAVAVALALTLAFAVSVTVAVSVAVTVAVAAPSLSQIRISLTPLMPLPLPLLLLAATQTHSWVNLRASEIIQSVSWVPLADLNACRASAFPSFICFHCTFSLFNWIFTVVVSLLNVFDVSVTYYAYKHESCNTDIHIYSLIYCLHLEFKIIIFLFIYYFCFFIYFFILHFYHFLCVFYLCLSTLRAN